MRRGGRSGGGGGAGRGGGNGGGGGGRSGGGGGGGGGGVSSPGICFEFQNKGYCKNGSNCKYQHGSAWQNNANKRGSAQGPSGVRVGGTARNVQDSNRLIKQLKNTHQSILADVIVRAGPLWNQCWADASSSHIALGDVELLLQTLAKVPFSQETKVPPPPIHALSSAMKRYLTSNAGDPLLAAETALNVVRKALCFEWSEKRLIVKEALGKMLEDSAKQLHRRNQDHRDCLNRIDDCLDKLEKPWIIKEKNQAASTTDDEKNYDGTLNQVEDGGVPRHHHSLWRTATVEWLVQSSTFSPAELPKMQGPSTKSRGVYQNREHYFDTMQRLMVAMAFHEGHAALAPQCWERCSGGQSCGGALVRLPDGVNETSGGGKSGGGSNAQSSGPLRCRGRGCRNAPVFI